MNAIQVIIVITAVLLTTTLMWFAILYGMKKGLEEIKGKMYEQYGKFIIEPKSALYRGSDRQFGNVKGNGVICLTENNLIFKKIIGQQIEIARAEIIEAKVKDCFKGEISFGTGGQHLVVKTKDGNHVGFLLRDAKIWAEKVRAV